MSTLVSQTTWKFTSLLFLRTVYLLHKLPLPTPTLTDVDELGKATVPDYTNDFLPRGHRYQHVITGCLGLAIDVDDLRVLMAERAVATWMKLRMWQISDGTALHESLDEFGFISAAAQFCLPFAFTKLAVHTLRNFSEMVQHCADGPGEATLRHCFCVMAEIEIAFHVSKDIVD